MTLTFSRLLCLSNQLTLNLIENAEKHMCEGYACFLRLFVYLLRFVTSLAYLAFHAFLIAIFSFISWIQEGQGEEYWICLFIMYKNFENEIFFRLFIWCRERYVQMFFQVKLVVVVSERHCFGNVIVLTFSNKLIGSDFWFTVVELSESEDMSRSSWLLSG